MYGGGGGGGVVTKLPYILYIRVPQIFPWRSNLLQSLAPTLIILPIWDFLMILKTLISMLRCVWLGLEVNSAGMVRFEDACCICWLANKFTPVKQRTKNILLYRWLFKRSLILALQLLLARHIFLIFLNCRKSNRRTKEEHTNTFKSKVKTG